VLAPVLATLALTVPASAAAGPGDPDRGFGGDGRIALPAAGAFVPRAVAVDGSDRIVVGGYSCAPDATGDGTCLTSGDGSFRIARLTPDGGLDPEFGENGFVTTPVGEGRSQALDLIVLRDGRVLAGGVARSDGRDVFALARYSAGGALDPGFGDGGIALAPTGSAFASLSDITLGPGGTVVGAGQAVDALGVPRMAVARFTAQGALDGDFGTGGVTLGGAGEYGYGLGLDVAPDGAALVAGLAGDSPDAGSFRFGELRVTRAGAPARSFGSNGSAQQRVGSSSSFATAVGAVGSGWLTAGAAIAADGRQAMAALRLGADGRPEGSYGRRGSRVLALGDGAIANDLVAERDGHALLVGQVARADGGYDFAVAALRGDGTSDRSFGDGGSAFTSWPDYPIARATAGARQRSGDLVTVGLGCVGGVGVHCDGGTARGLIARLQGPDGTPPQIRVRPLRGLRLRVTVSEPARIAAALAPRRGGGLRWFAKPRRLVEAATLRVPPRGRSARGRRSRFVIRAVDQAGNGTRRRFTIRVRP